jgi:hypothetical protein
MHSPIRTNTHTYTHVHMHILLIAGELGLDPEEWAAMQP